MKIMAVNGSPRTTGWNTITLLENVLAGAASQGAESEVVHLYNLQFSGCISCFSCKKVTRKVDGVCAVQDDLTSVLARIKEIDALVVGTPVYYGAESAATRAFIERLCFPYNKYAKDRRSLFPRRINTALIYTMNVAENMIESLGYPQHFALTKGSLERYFGPCELLLVTDTLQYSDYNKYESEMFDQETKKRRHKEVFPGECQKAFDLGVRLALSR